MIRPFLLLLTFLTVNVLRAVSQPYCDVRTFSLRDGLAANIISGMGQTPDHLMWFGTWNGLCYFDGYRFTTYRDTPGKGEQLSSNRVLNLETNSKGNVWVLSYDRHLYLFDTRLCQYVNVDKLLDRPLPASQGMRWVFPLGNGYTWATGEKGSTTSLRLSDDLTAPSSAKGSQQQRHGISVYTGFQLLNALLDGQGREWLLTDHGVRSADGRIWSSLVATRLVNLGTRTYFISKEGGVVSLGKGERRMRRESRRLSGPLTVNDACAWRGTIVLATSKGVYQLAHGKTRKIFSPLLVMGGGGDSNVHHLFVDNRRRLWIFTSGDGVYLNDGQAIQHLQALPASQLELTSSAEPFIIQDQHGTIWTVPTRGTFSYYDESRRQLVPYPLHAASDAVATIPLIKKYFVDSQHNLWFTGNRNLTLLDFRLRRVRHIATAPNHNTRALLVDRKGNLWVGDETGRLALYDRNYRLKGYLTPTGRIQPSPTSFSTRVYALYEDRRGRLWIGSKVSGLYCLDQGRVSHFVSQEKSPYCLSHNDIYDICEDTRGRIWVATYGGGVDLIDERDGNIRFLNRHNLMRDYPGSGFLKVRRITKTPQGVMLLSTNFGLVTFSDHFRTARDIRFYTTTHHIGDTTSLQSIDVMQTLVTRSGKIYVNTMGGGLQALRSQNLLSDNLKLDDIHAVTADEGLVQSMIEDPEGNIWLVREGTLNKFLPRSNQLFTYDASNLSAKVEFSEAIALRPAGSSARSRPLPTGSPYAAISALSW